MSPLHYITFTFFSAAAQTPGTVADSALRACIAAQEAGRAAEARAAAGLAERSYRELLRAHPDDPAPRVGLARVISECRVPQAGVLRKGGLIEESNRLLETVLQADSLHWEARYTLALNYYHLPRFFGKTDDAIRQFERLLAQQGDRTDFPERAGPYAYLGDLYMRRDRREEAWALWRRGAALFPNDARLRRRLERTAGERPDKQP